MKEIKCPNCKHKQKTNSKLRQVTCSSCGNKIRIEGDSLGDKLEAENPSTSQSEDRGMKNG